MPGDSVDMRWALSTADSLWSKGDRTDAIRWLQRAAQAASDAELDGRALELAKVAAELTSILTESQRPPPNSKLPSFPVPPHPAPAEFTPIAPPVSTPPPAAARPPSRAPLSTDERITTVHERLPPPDDDWDDDTDTSTNAKSLGTTAAMPISPDSSSSVDLSQLDTPGLKTSQAVRVVLWRDGNGVHIAPHGTVVSAITIDAMVVAIHPDADLASWLSSGKK